MTSHAVEKLVGAQVRIARRRAGLTQALLAERAGVSFETVSRIERGVLSPTARTVVALASALGVGPGELLEEGGSVWPTRLDESLQAVVEPLLDQPGAVRATAARLVRALVED